MGENEEKAENYKIFTAESGKFQMLIPIEWEYKNPSLYKSINTVPEAFGMYGKLIGAFQISCKEVNQHIKGIIEANGLTIQSSGLRKLKFFEKLVEMGKTHNYMWLCAVDDHFFLATYIVNTREHNSKKGILEFEIVRSVLNNVKFIKPQFRGIVISQNRYRLFMASIAATIDLRNRAIDNGSFIECIVLTANHIDALLRSAIILTNQLEQRNSDIDSSVLFQSEADKPIMEKEIYRRALTKNIINQELFDQLIELYNERNKVVHRYIITDIRTEDILRIAYRYDELDDKVWELISGLEKKQFEQKIGLYGDGIEPGTEMKGQLKSIFDSQIRDKHGRVKHLKG